MNPRSMLVALVVGAALLAAPVAAANEGTTYYLSLGDSYADSAQPNGDFEHGYAEQLHEILVRTNPPS